MGDVIVNPEERDNNGRFAKGNTLSTRVKASRKTRNLVSEETRKHVGSLKTLEEKIEYWDRYLLDNPLDKTEVFKITAELRKYLKPTLKSVETTVNKFSKIEVSWLGGADTVLDIATTGKVIDHKQYIEDMPEGIEHAVNIQLIQDVSEDID